MSILFKDYEVSIWNYVDNGDTFEESKLATIGSSDMTALSRCVQPNLTLRANGNNTFSFVLYTRYYDGMEKVDNPFIKLMYNGRRVKVRVEDEWYDFVITDIQESSDNKSVTYSCVDAFNYELGKSGYELEFDEELETQGSTTELAEEILAGTAWEVDYDKNEDILQYKYEQLVEYQVNPDAQEGIIFTQVLDDQNTITVNPGYYFYGFYSQINDIEKQQFIIYDEIGDNKRQIGSDAPVSLDKLEYPTYYTNNDYHGGKPIAVKANRLVDTYDSNIDPTIDKYYTTYTKDNHEYRIYSEVEYKKPYSLINYIDVNGFMGYKTVVTQGNTYPAIGVETDYSPALTVENLTDTNRQKYYKWLNKGDNFKYSFAFYGINSLKNKIKFISKDTKLVLKVKYLTQEDYTAALTTHTGAGINRKAVSAWMGDYKGTWRTTADLFSDMLMKTGSIYPESENNTIYYILEPYNNNLETQVSLLNKSNLKLALELDFTNFTIDPSTDQEVIRVVETELFDYLSNENSTGRTFYLPEELLDVDNLSIEPITYYYVYDPAQEPAYTGLDDLVILEKTTDISSYTPKTRNFIKIRSITGKQSNRFNLLQTICERFECWLHFSFEREPNGKIISKKVYFTDTQGKQVHYGFISGINLKNSQRTLKSENLVTRLVVSPNANEFAEGGSCNISLSQWNYTGENALYNFDYYLSKGAIDRQTWLDDFYYIHSTEPGSTETEDDDGWFVKLHNKNQGREELIINITELTTSLNKAEANLKLSEAGWVAAQDEREAYDDYIEGRAGAPHDKIVEIFEKQNPTEDEQKQKEFWTSLLQDSKFSYYWVKYEEANNSYENYLSLASSTQEIYNELESQITNAYSTLIQLNQEKQEIYDAIYAKYYPFIAEGSWINEDYFDNDLYYVDAETTLYTSAYPEVSYSLSVVDLESLDDFKQYKFIPGDISFVQDTDFFGWEDDNITPHKLKVWISEKKINLDDPTNTTITVQNYANDFDSLFQKITAATQTLQYKEGVYNRSGKIVNGDGQVEYQAIADTLRINPISLENLGAQSVSVGDDGITVTSLLQPSHKVRIIGDGIYISNDGGNEYFPVITGAGTNLSKLTAGQIDTTNINIVDGNFNAFRWDENGINAYWYENIGDVKTYNTNKFVRLDRFGLYGYNNDTAIYFKPQNIDDVIDNTLFSLTWKGLNFKSASGKMSYSSEQNQLTIQGQSGLITLGYLYTDENNQDIYGLSIGDLSDVPELQDMNNTLDNYTRRIKITDTGVTIVSGDVGESSEGSMAELTADALTFTAHQNYSKITADGFIINDGNIQNQLTFNNEWMWSNIRETNEHHLVLSWMGA